MVNDFTKGGGREVEAGRVFKYMNGEGGSTTEKPEGRAGRKQGLEGLKIELVWGKVRTKLLTRGEKKGRMWKGVTQGGEQGDGVTSIVNEETNGRLWGGEGGRVAGWEGQSF